MVVECDSELLVPVIVTVKSPLAVDAQERVEVPEPVMLVGESAQDNPVDGDATAVRPTVPLNPLTAVTVMVDVAEPPTPMLMVVGPAMMVKSWPV